MASYLEALSKLDPADYIDVLREDPEIHTSEGDRRLLCDIWPNKHQCDKRTWELRNSRFRLQSSNILAPGARWTGRVVGAVFT